MSANNSHVIERSSFLNGANKRKAGDKGVSANKVCCASVLPASSPLVCFLAAFAKTAARTGQTST
jgi:hypothetical protein